MRFHFKLCESDDVRAFVEAGAGRSPDGAGSLFTFHRGNDIWRATLPGVGEVVAKESCISRDYGFFEGIGRRLRLRVFDVNLRDARAALMAESLGVATYHPLAVWSRRGPDGFARGILYTFVEGKNLNGICKGGAFDEADRPAVKRHLFELGQMARRLNDGGLRHRDLHPQNVVVRPDGSLALLDFASGYNVRCRWPRYRLAADFASLRRLARLFDADCLESFCAGYCEGRPAREYEHALMAMLFWKYNGLKGTGGLHRFGFMRDMATFMRIR